MPLKQFNEFWSSMNKIPEFRFIRQKAQQRFLVDAYKLAKEKHETQLWIEANKGSASRWRTSITNLLYASAHLRNALSEIENAKKRAASARPTGLMRDLQVLEAQHLIRAAHDDIGFLIGMDIAGIHPKHRTDFERRFRKRYPNFVRMFEEKYSRMPGRLARLDYQLVADLNLRLNKCRTSRGKQLRPVDRHRIISRVFAAAFGEKYPKATVKTAIFRTSRS